MVPYPTNYDLNVFSGSLTFQPLRVGFQLSGKAMLELNLFQSELSYFKKKGSRTGTSNTIERSQLFLGNKFLSNIQIAFTHRLK